MNIRRTSKDELIHELEAAGAVIRGNAIKCPFHDDHTPSGGVFQGKDGAWRFKCQSCGAAGDVFDIQARRQNRPLAEILKENAQDRPQIKTTGRPLRQTKPMTFIDLQACYTYLQQSGGNLEALHEYTGADGSHNQYVIRWRIDKDNKTLRPAVKTPAGLELRKAEKPVLYRLPTLAQAENICIVEGEKKADILAGYGFTVTTSAFGYASAKYTDWRPLSGRQVIIWPDYDTPGRQYADDVRKILEGFGCSIKVIDPSTLDLQESEDCADYIAQLKNAGFDDIAIRQNLLDIFSKAQTTGAGAEVQQHIAGIVSGKYVPLETCFSCLDDLMQILPGSLNLVCGSPGSSKSLMMLQLGAKWYKAGIKTPIYELEKDRCFHLRRALAQESGQAMMTNNKWVLENAELAQRTAAEHLDFMDGFGRMIYATPEKIVYQKDIVEWVQQRADTGCKAVIIDPATKAERQDEPYKADGQFIQQLAKISTMTRLVIFLVLHPAKTVVMMPDLSQIAGGAAYSRFADNAIWLESHDEKKSFVKTCCGTVEEIHDRTIWILKSRDGSGTGSRIAYRFNKNNLTLSEIGQIQHGKKNK